MRSGQGAVEYIMILGVIILIAIITVLVVLNLNQFEFVTSTEARLNDINNLLSDVALQQSISAKGFVQANLMTTRYSFVTDAVITIYSTLNETCNLSFGLVKSDWQYNSTDCDFLNGSAGETYIYHCIVTYTEPNGINHNREGICRGLFEE